MDRASRHNESLQQGALSPDDVLGGLHVPFCSLPGEGEQYLSFEHDGQMYSVQDEYCCNPSCDCQATEVFVSAIDATEQGKFLRRLFLARFEFGGKVRILETWSFTKKEARALMKAWLQSTPGLVASFRERYEIVKRIGTRSLERAGYEIETRPAAPVRSVRVGRNEPCPCGSGKKYKKCCGG